PPDAVAAEEERVGGPGRGGPYGPLGPVGSRGPLGQEEAYRLCERLVRLFQLVVRLQGLRDDHPGGGVARGGRADAGDDRAGLRLMAVLPQVRGLEGADQVGLVQVRGRREETVVEGGRGGAVAGELAVR